MQPRPGRNERADEGELVVSDDDEDATQRAYYEYEGDGYDDLGDDEQEGDDSDEAGDVPSTPTTAAESSSLTAEHDAAVVHVWSPEYTLSKTKELHTIRKLSKDTAALSIVAEGESGNNVNIQKEGKEVTGRARHGQTETKDEQAQKHRYEAQLKATGMTIYRNYADMNHRSWTGMIESMIHGLARTQMPDLGIPSHHHRSPTRRSTLFRVVQVEAADRADDDKDADVKSKMVASCDIARHAMVHEEWPLFKYHTGGGPIALEMKDDAKSAPSGTRESSDVERNPPLPPPLRLSMMTLLEKDLEMIRRLLAHLTRSRDANSVSIVSMCVQIADRYSFSVDDKRFMFPVLAMFNHSCTPNLVLELDVRNEPHWLTCRALRDIKEGEELSISYAGYNPSCFAVESTPMRRRMLYTQFGFTCTCLLCSCYYSDISDSKRFDSKALGSASSSALPLASPLRQVWKHICDFTFREVTTLQFGQRKWHIEDIHSYCSYCGRFGQAASSTSRQTSLARCGKCKSMRYCRVECQRLHWEESHRNQCRPCT